MGRPRQNKQTARLSVSFEKADYEQVAAIAEANDVSTAWIIRQAVTAYLDAYRDSALPFDPRRGQTPERAPVTEGRRGS